MSAARNGNGPGRRRIFAFTLPLIVLLPFAELAPGKCVLSMQIASVTWRGRNGTGYDPYDPTPYSQTVNFTLNKRGDACPFFVTFSKNTPGNNQRLMSKGNETLTYQIYDTTSLNNVLKDLPSASANEVISGTFSSNSKDQPLSLVIAMPAQQLQGPGTYTDSVRVSVYEGTLPNPIFVESILVQISALIPAIANLCVVSTGGVFDPTATRPALVFGELATGKSLGCDLRVRSNAGYTLSFRSENAGVLKNLDPAATDKVPYTMVVSGNPVALAQNDPQGLNTHRETPKDPNGDRYPIQVIIGTADNVEPGNYRDIITVTVRANN